LAIIAVLAALLFPAISGSMLRAKKARAANDCHQFATALRSYHSDYGRWPAVASTNLAADINLCRLLQGDHYVTNAPFQGNPRKQVYMEFSAKQLDAAGNFVDPWGKAYLCRMDSTGAETVANPLDSSATIARPVIVWSLGPDGLSDTAGENSAKNKDNVKSW
jgi:type II secretory pathway pseudopilin PulG